jgi:hypothetical protein
VGSHLPPSQQQVVAAGHQPPPQSAHVVAAIGQEGKAAMLAQPAQGAEANATPALGAGQQASRTTSLEVLKAAVPPNTQTAIMNNEVPESSSKGAQKK